MRPQPDPPAGNQESVWAYPRPAIAVPCAHRIRIVHRGRTIVDGTGCIRTLETSHPPSYYVPPAAVDLGVLRPSQRRSFCEWKGEARYFDLVLDGECLRDIAWSYPNPSAEFVMLRDHLAFYAAPLEGCFVDGERVTPQPGGFYGGWITSQVAGPFKGGPGSTFW